MIHKVEFEDVGQRIKWICYDCETGMIVNAGPDGGERFLDGAHFVDILSVKHARFLGVGWPGGVGVFKSPISAIEESATCTS